MKTVYDMVDESGREMTASLEEGDFKVTMTFHPEEGLTIEEVCYMMDWVIVGSTDYEKPKTIPFKRKD